MQVNFIHLSLLKFSGTRSAVSNEPCYSGIERITITRFVYCGLTIEKLRKRVMQRRLSRALEAYMQADETQKSEINQLV